MSESSNPIDDAVSSISRIVENPLAFFEDVISVIRREEPTLVQSVEDFTGNTLDTISTLNRSDATGYEALGAFKRTLQSGIAAFVQVTRTLEGANLGELADQIPVVPEVKRVHEKYNGCSQNPEDPNDESVAKEFVRDLTAGAFNLFQKLFNDDDDASRFCQNRREEALQANKDDGLSRLARSYTMSLASYNLGHYFFGPMGARVVGIAVGGLFEVIRSNSAQAGQQVKSVPQQEAFADIVQKAVAYALEGQAAALSAEQWHYREGIRAFEQVLKMRLSCGITGNIKGHEVWTVLEHRATGKWYFGVNQNARKHHKNLAPRPRDEKGNAYVQLTEPDEPLPLDREAETCAEMHAFAQLLVDQQLLTKVLVAAQKAKYIDKPTRNAFREIMNMSIIHFEQNSNDEISSDKSKVTAEERKSPLDQVATTSRHTEDEQKEPPLDQVLLSSQHNDDKPSRKGKKKKGKQKLDTHSPSLKDNPQGKNETKTSSDAQGGAHPKENKFTREQRKKPSIFWQRLEFKFYPPDASGNAENSRANKQSGKKLRGRELLNRLLFASFFLSGPADEFIKDRDNLRRPERKELLNPILNSQDAFERERAQLLIDLLKDENGRKILEKPSFKEFMEHPCVVAYCDKRSDADFLNEIAGIDVTNTKLYTFARKEDGTWINRGRCENCQARDSLMGTIPTDPSVPGADIPMIPSGYYFGPYESDVYETLTFIKPPNYYTEEREFMTNEQYNQMIQRITEKSRRLRDRN